MTAFKQRIGSKLKRPAGRTVDFCVIGAQKSGTTALFTFLSKHPCIQMSSKKEVHFFDTEKHFLNVRPDYTSYHKYFPESVHKRLLGEATPIYIYWPQAIERIAKYNPDMRLIAIFRDPIERAFAHWRMIYARGLDELTFPEAIRGGRDRVRLSSEFSMRHWSYVERGFYGAQIRRVFSYFPKSQIFAVRSEDLRDRHDLVMQSLFRFLEVDSVDIGTETVFGATPPTSRRLMRREDVEFLRRIYSEDLSMFSTSTGLDVSNWLSADG